MATLVDRGGLCLILGGVRSGKSSFAMALAQRCAEELGLRLVYVATAPALYAGAGGESGPGRKVDKEMAARIDRHRAERGEGWDTVEEPVEIARTVEDDGAGSVLMVDCLTLWITNLIELGLGDDEIIEKAGVFAGAASRSPNPVIVVSNEVGQGVVPQSPLGRRFRDLSGLVNQRVAALAKDVYFVTAGLPGKIKG